MADDRSEEDTSNNPEEYLKCIGGQLLVATQPWLLYNMSMQPPPEPHSWVLDDVQVEHNKSLNTTGGQLWPAAMRCLKFLSAMAPSLGLDRPGINVLELGAGLGYLGLSLARNLPSANIICLTEQASGGGLDWLQHNILANKHLPNMTHVTACECDWTDFAPGSAVLQEAQNSALSQQPPNPAPAHSRSKVKDLQDQQGQEAISEAAAHAERIAAPQHGIQRNMSEAHPTAQSQQTGDSSCGTSIAGGSQTAGSSDSKKAGLAYLLQTPWDFIIGSDLIYNHIGSQLLPRVIQTLSHAHTTTIYCHTKHRFDHLDLEFMEHVAACGLSCEEVREPWLEAPPPSPPPLTELFPELRIAVYKLQLRL